MRRRPLLATLLLLAVLSLAACVRPVAPTADPVPPTSLITPDAGTEPQATAPAARRDAVAHTREASPRNTPATAIATPTPAPTLEPSPEPTLATPALEAIGEPTGSPTPVVQTPPEPPTAEPTVRGEIIHVVQPGENLYRIGLQYGLSWVDIAEYNGILDPNAIFAGQEIRIPPQPATAPESSSLAPAVVTVSPGDTLYEIAKQAGVGWNLIAEANGLAAPNHIYAGQKLKIPADAPGPAVAFSHHVHRGETLSGIARQYGVLPAALAEANGLATPYVIFPGQELAIPGE